MTTIPLHFTPREPVRGFGLWRLGFRPFYLLAAGFSALSIAAWALQYAGLLGTAYLAGPLWHAHEMLFGFTLAVVVGFLFTAGRNWSGQPTPTGGALAALAALWLAGRLLVLTPWGLAAAVVNVAFPLLAAVGLGRALYAGRNQRNYFFVALLCAMAGAQALFHLTLLGVLDLPLRAGIQIGLDVVLFVMAVVAGRVVPMFTNNGVPGTGAERRPRVEHVALGSVLALLAADVLGLPGVAVAAVAGVAAVAHTLRLALWRPQRTRPNPLVWILHAAYAWIPLHLLLRAASELGWAQPSLATHALTAGAIGALTLGMMTRTARGHTGRPLRADRWDIAAYGLVLAGGLVRVLGPLLLPALMQAEIVVSGACWAVAFAIFAWRYAPSLWRVRADGQPG
ncbi:MULTISPECIES: NnrS family protein [unclassified Rubrivivax]|uniref:NnrS family protein n=1 Tax=unclassified Rubrivivax TaxID=2649762 RepID=UPI001E6062AB|nr:MULTISPECIES: NnrS family protein [unclassified Rubrivivax]MCC9597199.1 NnrS family protein [Rubrivivax sp. JA1055]MCC9646542.1 NnrS family protein [Rubrivivax sp. JA1029]